MALTKVMYILSKNCCDVVKTVKGFWKFIPQPRVLEWIKAHLDCNKIIIHGYILRHIKQIGAIELVILIPRIKVDGGWLEQKTHVLLPEFILPYCRYTVKSLATIEDIPNDIAKLLCKKEWDRIRRFLSNSFVQIHQEV